MGKSSVGGEEEEGDKADLMERVRQKEWEVQGWKHECD